MLPAAADTLAVIMQSLQQKIQEIKISKTVHKQALQIQATRVNCSQMCKLQNIKFLIENDRSNFPRPIMAIKLNFHYFMS